jgi:hypothetical protein
MVLVWLGCGGTVQGQIAAHDAAERRAEEKRAISAPTAGSAARCALSNGAAVACTVPGVEGALPVLFVREPGQPFTRIGLQPVGPSRYSAHGPVAPSSAAEYYVAVYRDGRFVGASRLRRLTAPAAAPVPSAAGPAPAPHLVARPVDRGTPPLSDGRLAAEVLVGGLIAIPGALAGASIGAAVDHDCNGDFCIPTSVAVGAYAGVCVGSAVGVYAVGVSGDQTGRFDATLFGSLLGGAIGLGLASITWDEGDGASLLFLLLPPFTATAAFNFTRRYEDGVSLQVPVPTVDSTGRVFLPIAAGRF